MNYDSSQFFRPLKREIQIRNSLYSLGKNVVNRLMESGSMAKKKSVTPHKPGKAKKAPIKAAPRAKLVRKAPAKAKPVKKSPIKNTLKKLKKVVGKSAAKAPVKKSAAASKSSTKKVTAHKVSGKMLRGAAVTTRPAKKTAKNPAVLVRKTVPAKLTKGMPVKSSPAKAQAKTVAKASTRSLRSKAPAERRALPHKAPPLQAFSFGDYFDGNASPYPTIPPGRRDVLPVAVEWKEKMRPGELYQAFKRFFEANEIGNRLIGTLREGAASIIEFEGDPQIYKIVKIRGRAVFEAGRPASVEAYVKFSRHAVEYILAPNATKPAEYVQRFTALMLEPDPAKRIELKLLCTHGEAIRKGYLGVVASGGKTLAEALVSLHFSLPAEFVRQLR
jgi:hypothetical protein